MSLFDYDNFYFVGLKGVGMTALAQLLNTAGKKVGGSDVEEEFVTQKILDQIGVDIDTDFAAPLPKDTECVIYTAAHNGKDNPQVQAAAAQNIPVYSHAEALGILFNTKKGIAVCGVGGKSTTSAMLAWIFEKTGRDVSYAVGVAEIIDLDHVGKWSEDSEYFIAEADEYAANPQESTDHIIPRFSYLEPYITISKKIIWDHPDVYRNFEHTLDTFNEFFLQIKPQGTLILPNSERKKKIKTSAQQIWDYGKENTATFHSKYDLKASVSGKTVGYLHEPVSNTKHTIELQIPGSYNFDNAVAAIIGAYAAKIPMKEAVEALKSFKSTKRRFEKIGTKNNITFFDDYAHHPMEVESAIAALNQWFPNNRKVVVFQPHTFSRTKELFNDFVNSLGLADELVLMDIFASARETTDPSIDSEMLADAIRSKYPNTAVHQAGNIKETAQLLRSLLTNDSICLTVGAGDVYKVHKMI